MDNSRSDKSRQRLLIEKIDLILLGALSGGEDRYKTPDGFTRWGVVQDDIHAAIDGLFAPSSTAAAHPGASASVCPTCGGNGNHRLARTEPLPCETCAGIGYVALSATARTEIIEKCAKVCDVLAEIGRNGNTQAGRHAAGALDMAAHKIRALSQFDIQGQQR